MARALDRESLLAAFDEIGRAAIAANARLSIAVFGGSALMPASNFRFATEDVDIAELGEPWPQWLVEAVERIAAQNGWSPSWSIPSPRYLLALKLKALRVADFGRGAQDMADVANLLRVLAIDDVETAIGVLAEYFPVSVGNADKQRFVLKRILSQPSSGHAPRYPRRDD